MAIPKSKKLEELESKPAVQKTPDWLSDVLPRVDSIQCVNDFVAVRPKKRDTNIIVSDDASIMTVGEVISVGPLVEDGNKQHITVGATVRYGRSVAAKFKDSNDDPIYLMSARNIILVEK